MNIIDELKNRGILNNVSNVEKMLKLTSANVGVYAGFDPSADSLHLGNYILISILKRFAQFGYKVYALIGGATGMIGDPSFRDTERVLLDKQQVINNKNKIKVQLESFGLKVIDNLDFYQNVSILDFLKDTGKLVNVNYMLAKDSVKNRLERGLSFTEFTYQLLQGNDFLKLYQNEGVFIQVGGSDQWGNITTGLDMISKVVGDNHKGVAVTVNLLTDENGKKIGKSYGGGALWIDKFKTSPYNMYQYLVNQSDLKVGELLNWLTFIPVDEIKTIIEKHNQNPAEHYAQKILADSVVADLYGNKELQQAQNITKILFDKNFDTSVLTVEDLEIIENYLPTVKITKGEKIVETLIKNNLIQSNREAREMIQTGALKIDNHSIDLDSIYEPNNFIGKYAFFKKGKKQTILLKTV
ncbi:tyrosine--tRNA ligase [Mycoplasmopsis felifaucium]|uniref:Tyrosine--tRNA ligase n=1 Tax=Mycoplasmopsis felifaucium TaxID=35768 RepID=A0ABZ2RP81_9BACT